MRHVIGGIQGCQLLDNRARVLKPQTTLLAFGHEEFTRNAVQIITTFHDRATVRGPTSRTGDPLTVNHAKDLANSRLQARPSLNSFGKLDWSYSRSSAVLSSS